MKVEGLSLIRNSPIQDGLYHLVSEIVVRHEDGTYLLTQRDYCKKRGGKWELSCGGSCLAGETSLDGAVRELIEETGLNGNFSKVGTFISDENHTIFDVSLCITDCEKSSVKLLPGETIDYCWLSRSEVLSRRDEIVSTGALHLLDEEIRE